MTWRLGFIFLGVMNISGCQLLETNKKQEANIYQNNAVENQEKQNELCFLPEMQNSMEHNCDINYWITYWSNIEDLSWTQRKDQIEELEMDSASLLKKILLSQGKGTPFKDRLRAQSWIESLIPTATPQMQKFLTVAIYQPSQELLEMESALVTIGKINSNLSQVNDEQKIMLDNQKLMIDKQKSQIDQLLKIEASIMDNGSGEDL